PAARVAPPPPGRRRLMIAGVAALALAAVVVVSGISSRSHKTARTQVWTTSEAVPAVGVVSPSVDAGARSLTLPGQLQAYYNAAIYSRVSGYVRAWYDDIGAHVKRGQLLAVIDTPETDQQIIQARADVATARANMTLASTTAQRWARLLKQDAVSTQESEEKAGDLAARKAQVQAAEANLNRYLALKNFSRITAPFDGVITARRTDIGALVNAGAGATANSELFDVAQVNPLRLYVRVPQVDSAEIRPGLTAALGVPELPGRSFAARLDTTANAIADASGTLLSELAVDNRDGALKPGAYAEVKFDFPDHAATARLILPSSAILFRNRGTEVAVVGPDNHVHIHHVVIAKDLGSTDEVASGLSRDDRVIDNPPDSIAEGQLVRVMDKAGG
ncbi:efflux RND transporter periplasmic adaptor subunit, partial [Caulobacter sp. S45]|uniref:efflux RND transporter periplasmic adaptor subunit n=1 Tax=Caulobacter sp. S45 TaxID=1641861 RepID=UPI0020C62CC3